MSYAALGAAAFGQACASDADCSAGNWCKSTDGETGTCGSIEGTGCSSDAQCGAGFVCDFIVGSTVGHCARSAPSPPPRPKTFVSPKPEVLEEPLPEPTKPHSPFLVGGTVFVVGSAAVLWFTRK